MPKTLYDKIWNDHLVDQQSDGTALLFVDRHLVHEVTSPQAFEGLRDSNRKVRHPKLTLAVADHNVPTTFFAVSQISIGFGLTVTFDVSWWAESLKLYNAMIVALCVTYTFVQGGHVRVDLFYSAVSYRTKRIIDMFGSIFFMLPAAILLWMYSWFFLWRHLIVPKPSASDTVEKLVMKARALRWNVETIGVSPNGFNAYFLFKVLILAYTGLIMIHAMAFFYRSFLEWREGEDAEGKYLDMDIRTSEEAGK